MKEFYYLKCINLMQINKEMRNNLKKCAKDKKKQVMNMQHKWLKVHFIQSQPH